MGLPIYFTFLHITAEGDECSLLDNVNKYKLLFTLGINVNGNHACVQSEGIDVYLIVLLIMVTVQCSFLCFMISLDNKSFEAEPV